MSSSNHLLNCFIDQKPFFNNKTFNYLKGHVKSSIETNIENTNVQLNTITEKKESTVEKGIFNLEKYD